MFYFGSVLCKENFLAYLAFSNLQQIHIKQNKDHRFVGFDYKVYADVLNSAVARD